MKKRNLMRLLSTIMIFTMLSTVALAIDEDTVNISDGDLWLNWLAWNDEGQLCFSETDYYSGFRPHPGEECYLAFFTCDGYDEDGEPVNLTPVSSSELVGSAGVNITPYRTGSEIDEYAVIVTVDSWETEYTISYDNYVMTFDSNLPDVALYSAPEMTIETYVASPSYNPLTLGQVYYIGCYVTENHPRYDELHLVDLQLLSGVDNDHFNFTTDENGVMTLALDNVSTDYSYVIYFEATFENSDGETWTEDLEFWFEPASAVVYSEFQLELPEDNHVPYSEVANYLSTSLEMESNEEKVVYVYALAWQDVENAPGWYVISLNPAFYDADEGLMLSFDEETIEEVTLNAVSSGEYNLFFYGRVFIWYLNDAGDIVLEEDEDEFLQQLYETYEGAIDFTFDDALTALILLDESGEEVARLEDCFIVEPDLSAASEPVTVTVGRTNDNDTTTSGATISEVDETVPVAPVFTDVAEGTWYYDAVYWAVENGITDGYGSEAIFAPDASCTRAQMVTFLWRAAGSPEPETTVMSFTDVSASAYYYDAVLWAVENGITDGYGSEAIFAPDASCTRAQMVAFLWRAADSPEPETTVMPFTDMSDSAYYYGAVLWAVENGITSGYGSETIYAPDVTCTRAQIVTFLYRYMG